MAVAYTNQICNSRGCYFEVTGDGVTTALVCSHRGGVFANTTATAFAVTAPTAKSEKLSGKGGFSFPVGTAVPITSVTVSASQCTVNTTSAIANGTKAYVCVVFNQYTATV